MHVAQYMPTYQGADGTQGMGRIPFVQLMLPHGGALLAQTAGSTCGLLRADGAHSASPSVCTPRILSCTTDRKVRGFPRALKDVCLTFALITGLDSLTEEASMLCSIEVSTHGPA